MKEDKPKLCQSVKAQAALEFLTTYGWAFLVILIMIGALAYFGILNPSKVLPNTCFFGSEFTCVDSIISASGGTWKVRLKNNVGAVIDVSQITYSVESPTAYTCTSPQSVPINTWKSGEIRDLSWGGCSGGGVTAGERAKLKVKITYNLITSGAPYARVIDGEIYTLVS
ncbi:MAG: hypothetical protein AABX33_02725 [Nanoarchaeota archaeon]